MVEGKASPGSNLTRANGMSSLWEWIRWQEKSMAQVWHTKQGVYRRKARADVLNLCRHSNEVSRIWQLAPCAIAKSCKRIFSCLPK